MKVNISRIPYDVCGYHTCLSRRIPGFDSRYEKYTDLSIFTALFFLWSSATGNHSKHSIKYYRGIMTADPSTDPDGPI